MLRSLGDTNADPDVYKSYIFVEEDDKVSFQVFNANGSRVFMGTLNELAHFMDELRRVSARAEAIAISAKGN